MTKLFGIIPSSDVVGNPVLSGAAEAFNFNGTSRLSTLLNMLDANSDNLSRYDDLNQIFRDHLEVVQQIESSSEQKA